MTQNIYLFNNPSDKIKELIKKKTKINDHDNLKYYFYKFKKNEIKDETHSNKLESIQINANEYRIVDYIYDENNTENLVMINDKIIEPKNKNIQNFSDVKLTIINHKKSMNYDNLEMKHFKVETTETDHKNNKILCLDSEKAFAGDHAFELATATKFCKNPPQVKLPKIDFRIVSFNVHNFHTICDKDNFHHGKNPDNVFNFINKTGPDIVLLQEFVTFISENKDDKKYKCDGNDSKYIEAKLDFSYFDNKMESAGLKYSIKTNDHEFTEINEYMGKAIYTKEQIENYDSVQLSNARGFLRTLYKINNTDVLIYNIHLTYFNYELFNSEISRLIKYINAEKKYYDTENVLIMGDFNFDIIEHKIDGETVEQLLYRHNLIVLNNNNRKSSYVQDPNGKTIDYAVCSTKFLEKFEIKNTKNDNHYDIVFVSYESDHYPIILDLAFK